MPPADKLQIVKYAPPPAELPALGRVDPAEVSFIGRTNYVAALEEKKFVFGIQRTDRRRHVYIVGKSGTGKSKVIELLMRQDIGQGRGICLFDPNGDLISDLLDFIPEERAGDVVIIDPLRTIAPILFNPLRGIASEHRYEAARSILEIFSAQFGSSWNPRMEHMMRFLFLALFEYPQSTMQGMLSMLTDENYRAKVTAALSNELIARFWQIEFPLWMKNEEIEANTLMPLINKIGQFLTDPLLRTIFKTGENRIDMKRFVDEKKIVLINCARSRLGKENATFLASLFIIKLKEAGMFRSRSPEAERDDFYVYIDEFHHLVTEAFENLMSEGRKYGFALTISHQYLGQIIEHFRASIFGNAGTIIVFRVSGEDAARLESEMAPVFKIKDMINLGRREFYIKLIIDGEPHDPFSAEALKILPANHSSYREKILRISDEQYGRGMQ